MRKRRKAKVIWLPSDLKNRLASAPAVATSDDSTQTIIAVIPFNPFGITPTSIEIPIVKDFSSPAAGLTGFTVDPQASLADIEQSGYRLRRIVGKLGFSVQQANAAAAGDVSIAHITAGFIIRRVNSDSGLSLAEEVNPDTECSTVSFKNIMDPWIWRRSWDLADGTAAAIALDPNVAAFPRSNYQYGAGIFDGPHVDAKTARVVGPEERLVLDVTVEGVNGNAQGGLGAVLLLGDLRVLGSMRSSSGNRRNASR